MATDLTRRGPTANNGAKLPSLQACRAEDPLVRNAIESLREWVEVRLGSRGDRYERAVLLREYEPKITEIEKAIAKLQAATGATTDLADLAALVSSLRSTMNLTFAQIWQAILELQTKVNGGNVVYPITVDKGGTGRTSLTPYAPLFGGETATDPIQSGTVGALDQVLHSNGSGAIATWRTVIESMIVACSNETTNLTTGTAKVTFRMPYAFTLIEVRASLTVAQTAGSIFTVDINDSGTTILSTKLTIDNGEKTSKTAATAAVISDANLADDAEITVDIDQVGTAGAKGLKIYLIGRRG